ncbi:hypothetical protein T484DRAFT_1914864 [Baffinella frigidus]|nr:hypothetical protein T484DRAFT_1914864 [Cryptophyta sp. CCMP2293]
MSSTAVRALESEALQNVTLSGKAGGTVRALDAEALQNVTLSGNLTSTTGVVILRAGRSSQAGVVVIAEGVTATAHTDLEVDAGERGQEESVVIAEGVKITAYTDLEIDAGERGQVNLTAPVALLAARHLKIQSDVWVTGTGVTQLSAGTGITHLAADADGNNDGTASLKLGRLITLPRNVTNGTLLLTADNLGFGARSVDMDVGALLVTASSWNLQSDCSTRSHLDVQSYNAAPDKFRRGAGPAFFEPVRTQVSSVRRSDGLLIYSSSSPASPAAASALSTRNPTRLTVEGTVLSADALRHPNF